MKVDDDQPAENTYITLEEAIKLVKEVPDEIPFPKAQPKRFTVHATADPGKNFHRNPSTVELNHFHCFRQSIQRSD